MSDYGFRSPEFLWAVVALPLVWVLWARRDKERMRRAALFGVLSPFDWRGCVTVVAVAGVALVALARPYIGREQLNVPRTGRDIIVLLDVSTSMLAADESPNRLAAARRKVRDLALRAQELGDRIGIVLFAGDAYLYCPLTYDSGVIELYLEALSPELIGATGSSLLRAVQVALDALRSVQARAGALVLMSDGEDSTSSVDEVLRALQEANVPLFALGFGSPEGRAIDTGRGRMVRDTWGQLVISKRNDTLLRAIAEGSGGTYLLPQADDQDLRSFFPGPENRAATRNQNEGIPVEVFREVGPYGALALLLLLTVTTLSRRRLPLLVFATVLLPHPPVEAEDPAARGAAAFYEEKYEEAAKGFAEALQQNPNDALLLRAFGLARYRAGDYAAAAQAFKKAAELSKSGRERFYNRYNQGNAELRQGAYDQAIRAYQEALRLKPEDPDTRFNLDLAERLKARSTPTPPPPATPSGAPSPQATPSAPPSPSPQQKEMATPTPGSGTAHPTPSDTTTPDGGSPAPTPSLQPTSLGTAEATPDQTANPADPTPRQGVGTATPVRTTVPPSPQPTATIVPIQTIDPAETPMSAAGEPPQHDPRELRESEAELWLKSLGQTPLMTRRQRRSLNLGGQSW